MCHNQCTVKVNIHTKIQKGLSGSSNRNKICREHQGNHRGRRRCIQERKRIK